MPTNDAKPIGVPVSTAIFLVGQSEHTVRRKIAEGTIQLLPGSGDKRISISALEGMAGRLFTVEEIANAEARATRARAAYLAQRRARKANKLNESATA